MHGGSILTMECKACIIAIIKLSMERTVGITGIISSADCKALIEAGIVPMIECKAE